MLAKKIALGFGIAIILPLLIHYGVSTFWHSPNFTDYQIDNYYGKYERATPVEKAKLEKEKDELFNKWQRDEHLFQRALFYVAVPIGLIAILYGSLTSIQAVGTGLMFGGIFSVVDGYSCCWSLLDDWMRFLSLLIAFVVLLFIGYKKLAK